MGQLRSNTDGNHSGSDVAALVYDANFSAKLEARDIEKAYARLFSTEDGRKVLGHLQAITFHRALAPHSAEEELRYIEGQRAMMASILRLIDRGRQP